MISPGEKSQLRFCCAKNMFLRVSGTLRNPPGTLIKTTMPRTQKPGTYRVEFSLPPKSIRRLDLLKKSMGFHNRDEVLDALLYQSAIDHQIDPDLRGLLEQKIDYLIEKIEMMT